MRTLRTVRDVRYALHEPRSGGRRIGLVPTMGALHDGHAALVRTARAECDVVVVSLYVNPLQFGRGEDFERYPRDEGADAELCAALGADLLFAPADEVMYPTGFATRVDPGPLGLLLEGAARPGHFDGVATLVARLLGIVSPHVAFFGLKDYQQLLVIRRVVDDLAIPCEIRSVATVREPDGLARSSRNRLLAPAERAAAAALPRGLEASAAAFAAGERDAGALLAPLVAAVADAGLALDYAELRDAETLGPWSPDRAGVVLVAARAGATRLLDNVLLLPSRGLATDPRRSPR